MAVAGDAPLTVDIRAEPTANSVPEPTRPGRSALDYLFRSCDLATRSLAWRLLGSDDLDDVLLDAYDTAHRQLGQATSSEIARQLHRSAVWNGTRDAAEELRRIVIRTCVGRVLSGWSPPDDEQVPPPVQAPAADRIRWAWRTLPGDQRLVLALALHERHKLGEIASLLGTTTATVDRLLGEGRSSVLGALGRERPGGRAGDGGEPPLGPVIPQVQQLEPPTHRADFWERVDRRLDRLEGRAGDPGPADEQPVEPAGRRNPVLAPIAALVIIGAVVVGGWLALPDPATDESADAPTSIENADASNPTTSSLPPATTTTAEATTTTVAVTEPVAAPAPTTADAPASEDPTSTAAPDDGAVAAGSGACVDPPTGWGEWEAADSGPNEGDEVYFEIFVEDEGDPCKVTVEVTVDVWIWDDHVVSPYIELAGERQVIHEGEVGYDFDNLPFTTVLTFDKPGTTAGWVLGYAGYYYGGDDGGFFRSDTPEVSMGPEQSPPLTDLE